MIMEKKAKSIGFSLKRVSTEQFAIIEEGEEDNHERRLNRRKAMDLLDFKKITFDEQVEQPKLNNK